MGGADLQSCSRKVGLDLRFPQFDCVLDYAPGASMRQEVYRVAFDEASAELSEILAKFEQLRSRKDRIEKVVEALKPLVAIESAAPSADRAAAPVERQPVASDGPGHALSDAGQATTPSPIPYPMQQPASDPFSRRIETAVGQSSSAKDVSEYSRLFNTGVTRGS